MILVETAATYSDVSNKDQRLYSLELVFYELFSGGGKPQTEVAEAEMKQTEDICDTEEQRNKNGDIKLSNALKLIDDNKYDEAEGRHSKRQSVQREESSQGKKSPALTFETLWARAVPSPWRDLSDNMISTLLFRKTESLW